MVYSTPEMKCRFCGENLSPLGESLVCNNCRIIAQSEGTSDEKIYSNIKEVINSIQKHLDKLNTWNGLEPSILYDIECRKLNCGELSDKEVEIEQFCKEFIKCKNSIEAFTKAEMGVNTYHFRQELYLLLSLSLQFEKIFDEKCTMFTMK